MNYTLTETLARVVLELLEALHKAHDRLTESQNGRLEAERRAAEPFRDIGGYRWPFHGTMLQCHEKCGNVSAAVFVGTKHGAPVVRCSNCGEER